MIKVFVVKATALSKGISIYDLTLDDLNDLEEDKVKVFTISEYEKHFNEGLMDCKSEYLRFVTM